MHVRTCKGEHVHCHGVDESIQAIQSAFPAEHLVASGAGETPAHGGRMAQEVMGLARSRKTEIVDHERRCAAFGALGGRKMHRNSP